MRPILRHPTTKLVQERLFHFRGIPKPHAGSTLVKLPSSEESNPPPDHDLTSEQAQVLKLVKEGHNVFFTGPAGSGKSLIIQHIKHYLGTPYAAVVAPTGVAAQPLGGTTIHSWAGVGKGDKSLNYYKLGVRRRGAPKSWNETRVLIIDEISMLSPELFTKLNQLAKYVRRNNNFFGGIQLVVTGDFYQLPPVDIEESKLCAGCGFNIVPREERWYFSSDVEFLQHPISRGLSRFGVDPEGWNCCTRLQWGQHCRYIWNDTIKYAFQTPSWLEARFRNVVLKEILRQTDKELKDALQMIKTGDINNNVSMFLDGLRRPLEISTSGIKPTRLYTHRAAVNEENQKEFDELPERKVEFRAVDSGVLSEKPETKYRESEPWSRPLEPEELDEHYFKNFQLPKTVQLKVDAQVLLLHNIDIKAGLSNGSRGRVVRFKQTFNERYRGTFKYLPIVSFLPHPSSSGSDSLLDREITIEPVERNESILRPDGNILKLSRLQIPLALAWATTIHKSQGMTLDYAIVDIEKAFMAGQGYVALSRVRNKEGLEIWKGHKKWSQVLWAHHAVVKFYELLEREEASGRLALWERRAKGIPQRHEITRIGDPNAQYNFDPRLYASQLGSPIPIGPSDFMPLRDRMYPTKRFRRNH